jgi:hypothetical protein
VSALVIMACCCTKAAATTPIPAIELYQGVMYQTLREHRPAHDDLEVLIVSAEHGLLWGTDEIETYDQRMTAERADELIAAGIPDDMVFFDPMYERILLAGGAEYRRVMRAYVDAMRAFGQIADRADVMEVHGGIGEQRQQLAAFLRWHA